MNVIFTFLFGVFIGILVDKLFISKIKITYGKTKPAGTTDDIEEVKDKNETLIK